MIIGLCSLKPQVGKSTSASFLEKKGYKNYEISFLVEVLAENILGYNYNKQLPEQRKKLQEIGLLVKQHTPDFWVVMCLARLYERDTIENDIDSWGVKYKEYKYFFENDIYKSAEKNIIISGIRSKEEADFIVDIGGRVVLIERDVAKSDSNPVESGLVGYKKFHGLIMNNFNFDYLENKINIFVGEDHRNHNIVGKSKICRYTANTIPSYWEMDSSVKEFVEKYDIGVV